MNNLEEYLTQYYNLCENYKLQLVSTPYGSINVVNSNHRIIAKWICKNKNSLGYQRLEDNKHIELVYDSNS